jgi:hypothetical protein
MALKAGIFSLALGALLIGSTAQADDTQNFSAGVEIQVEGFRGGYDQNHRYDDDEYNRYGHGHTHGSSCNHGPAPRPTHNQQGRYEIQLVKKFVPGRYEQVWVPEDCRYRPRRGVMKCTGGYYEQRWVPGRYEMVEEWVWVPGRWHRGSDSRWAAPANYRY